MNFSELVKDPSILKAIKQLEFTQATFVQEQAIPLILKGHDVLGCAQTGTGKTVAFLLPIVEKLLQDEFAVGLVLVPTRELAQQIHEVLKHVVTFVPEFKSALLIGGASMRSQATALSLNPRVIIATPGRLIDHLGNSDLNLKAVKFLVLDEADRLLDMGFLPQINEIQTHLDSGKRQTILFSATMPEEIVQLAKTSLRNPKQLLLGEDVASKPKIRHESIVIERDKKDDYLLDQINARKGLILIFTRTQLNTDHVTEYLESYGVPVVSIHGGKSQGRRTQAIAKFRDGTARVLVATDIAARGLDIPGVEHVINYDIPLEEEDFVHRTGRTGRAGRVGHALSMIGLGERAKWLSIEKYFGLKPNAELAKVDSSAFGSSKKLVKKLKAPLTRRSGSGPNVPQRGDRREANDRRGANGGGNRSVGRTGGGKSADRTSAAGSKFKSRAVGFGKPKTKAKDPDEKRILKGLRPPAADRGTARDYRGESPKSPARPYSSPPARGASRPQRRDRSR